MARAEKRQRKKDNARMAREAREAALKRQRQRKTAIRVGIFVALFAIVVVLFAVLGNNHKSKPSASATSTSAPATSTTFVPPGGPTATIATNFGTIVVRLDSKNAPKATQQFVMLANKGFYNHLTWHRAVKDFVIQGGDPKGNGTGGYGHPIVGEVPKDHYPLGSVAAAKTGSDPAGTFDSQFFIVTGSQGATLPNDYARFGEVTSGLDVAQKIEALAPASGDGPPTQKATIDKITITQK